jgi:hypothetical protein
MKKLFLLATAAFLVTGVTYANCEKGKKKCAKGKKCCSKAAKCCKDKSKTAKL